MKPEAATTEPGSLQSIIAMMRRPGTTAFDAALASFLDGVQLTHNMLSIECSAGHQYGSDFEACVEFMDAYKLAVAWLQTSYESERA